MLHFNGQLLRLERATGPASCRGFHFGACGRDTHRPCNLFLLPRLSPAAVRCHVSVDSLVPRHDTTAAGYRRGRRNKLQGVYPHHGHNNKLQAIFTIRGLATESSNRFGNFHDPMLGWSSRLFYDRDSSNRSGILYDLRPCRNARRFHDGDSSNRCDVFLAAPL